MTARNWQKIVILHCDQTKCFTYAEIRLHATVKLINCSVYFICVTETWLHDTKNLLNCSTCFTHLTQKWLHATDKLLNCSICFTYVTQTWLHATDNLLNCSICFTYISSIGGDGCSQHVGKLGPMFGQQTRGLQPNFSTRQRHLWTKKENQSLLVCNYNSIM
jgi:hypothetical protein